MERSWNAGAASRISLRSIRATACRCTNFKSDRKTRPAATGGGGVGIGDLERGADQIVDEIDLGAFHVAQRDRIDQHGGAVPGDHEIVRRLALFHVEAV